SSPGAGFGPHGPQFVGAVTGGDLVRRWLGVRGRRIGRQRLDAVLRLLATCTRKPRLERLIARQVRHVRHADPTHSLRPKPDTVVPVEGDTATGPVLRLITPCGDQES